MRPEKTESIKILFLLTLLLLGSVLLLPNATYAAATLTFSVSPSSVLIANLNCTVSVKLSPVSGLSQVHFRLSFNDGVQFLQVPAQGIVLGDLFAGVTTIVTTANYYLSSTARSYVDILIELSGSQRVTSTTEKTVASITFNLMPNALAGMTSGLNLEMGEALLYDGSNFVLVDYPKSVAFVNGQVTVGYVNTELLISVPANAPVEKPVTLSSILTAGIGNPLAGLSVDYYVGSAKVGTGITDASGNSSVSYIPSSIGTFTVRATYLGNQPGGKYAGSNSTVSLTVTKLNTSLVLFLPQSTKIGTPATFVATLKKDSAPLGGAAMSFSVLPPGGSWTPIASAITDANGAVAVQYTFSSAGTFSVRAEYSGTTNYRSSSDNATLVLALGTTSLKISVIPSLNPKVDQTITISSILKDSDGNGLANKNIDYYFNSQKVGSSTTDFSGVSSVQYAATAESSTDGSKIIARFNGDSAFSSSSDNLTVIVSKIASSVSFTLSPSTINVQQKTTLSATLQDESSKPISNSNVDFYTINGTQWTKIGSSVTTSSGAASLDFTPTMAGSYTIRANYSGSYKYQASTSDQMSLAVNTITTSLMLTVTGNGKVNQQTTLVATLADGNQRAILGKTVQFFFSVSGEEQNIGSATTDQNGAARIPFTPTNVATYTIQAKFGQDTMYAASSDTKTLAVDSFATTLIITANTVGKVGDEIPIVATLSDESNQSMQAMSIEYSLVSNEVQEKLGTQTTNSSSMAVQFFTPSAAGTYTIKASYAGDGTHAASSKEVIITINKVQTILQASLSNSTIQPLSVVKISATLTDENQQPIEQAIINYQISEAGGQWTNFTVEMTDFYGVATAWYTPTKVGTTTIRAVYNGDARYVEKIGSEMDLVVIEDQPPFMAIPWIAMSAIFIALTVVLGTFFVRRRRKPAEESKSSPIQDFGY